MRSLDTLDLPAAPAWSDADLVELTIRLANDPAAAGAYGSAGAYGPAGAYGAAGAYGPAGRATDPPPPARTGPRPSPPRLRWGPFPGG